ncbi:MAG TPA: SpoIID/LytB domain-containing protein [Candidatus Limnocylindrales bacterium]|nr:SpoIID/LytB domain-containing protein [Candidatus Limnocylindrales bacterium]
MRQNAIRFFALLIAISLFAFAVPEVAAYARARVDVTTASGDATVRSAPVARGQLPQVSQVGDNVANARRSATYAAEAPVARPGDAATIAVTIRNLSDQTWDADGKTPVRLSYHLYDEKGAVVAWDGVRTDLAADVAPGATQTIAMRVAVPGLTGTYTVAPDLIRDGVAWFSSGESPAGSFPLRVTTELDVAYRSTTTPATMVPGAEVPVQIRLRNAGLSTWDAAGSHPVRLSYHWIDAGGTPVVWDGPRSALPFDVKPGQEILIAAAVRAPLGEGAYLLAWDMVQDGIGWFSGHAVPVRQDEISVSNDITIYGKGWGHGIGLSQWGAQGWAEGAAGPRLTGEQIVAKYFPLATLATQPQGKPFRVLVSAPSTGCVGRTIYDIAHMRSEGGMRLVNDNDPSVVYLQTEPGQTVRFGAYGAVLLAVDEASGRVVFEGEGTSLTLVPTQWWDPIAIREKGLAYRGNVLVQVRDDNALRVVNYVGSDDYMKGALPGEMPSDWEMEALRAQAITARTYVAWRQSTAGDRTWDVRDDTADQCYGGHSFESPRTTAAVASTPASILTYDGKPIRALYSSANGGITENVGCVLEAERAGSTWRCADGWPYLGITIDPAEALAYDRRGRMPHGLWAETFSSSEMRELVADEYGVDIGGFVSMEFNESPGGRPISVRIRGTRSMVDVKGDRFLRTVLGLKSTLVRMRPF